MDLTIPNPTTKVMVDADLTPFEPADEYVIDSIEKLRVVSNPLRMQIINTLIPAPRTVKEVGDLLDIKSNTLYYHVGELEAAGMIELVGAIVKSGIQHKYYRASGRYYRLLPSLLHIDGEPDERRAGADFLAGAIEVSARNLRQSVHAGAVKEHPDLLRVSRRTIRTTPEQALALRERVGVLEREFIAADDHDAPLRIEFQFALFPALEDKR
ncbi:MAG TPA: helix-turn-helix domain-containing protein [Thermomicrobiales bacterium]|nr:helix-turn-helix domain-containing protein [Thermomicrobiales bacterium]